MKFKRINDITAISEQGQGWFRELSGKKHINWKKCDVCGKTDQYYWLDWPDKEAIVCDNCMSLCWVTNENQEE